MNKRNQLAGTRSHFIFYLPALEVEAEETEEAAEFELPIGTETVLLVDAFDGLCHHVCLRSNSVGRSVLSETGKYLTVQGGNRDITTKIAHNFICRFEA